MDQPRPHPPATAGPGIYDELTEPATYRGPWQCDRQFPSAWQGTLVYTNTPKSSVEFDYDGAAVSILYTAAANRRRASVVLDNRPPVVLSEWSSATRWQQRFSLPAEPGRHRLHLEVLDGYVDVDGWTVDPAAKINR